MNGIVEYEPQCLCANGKSMRTELQVLKQRKLLSRVHKYRLLGNGVEFEERSLQGGRKQIIHFEDILDEPIEIRTSSEGGFWATIILWVILVFGIISWERGPTAATENRGRWFWGVFCVIATVGYLNSRTKYLVYKGGQPYLLFLNHNYHQKKLKQFIEAMMSKRAEYIREKYPLDLQRVAPADAIHKLAWLRESKAITDEEFEILKKDIIDRAKNYGTGNLSLN